MVSSNAKALDKKYILHKNLGSKQSGGDDIWPVYVLLQKKIFLSKQKKLLK